MTVIVIDGPEKAGKTTLINELVKTLIDMRVPVEQVHWGPVSPDDRVYSPVLKEHCQDLQRVWVWDRGWSSEYVYGKLLNRDHRGASDPWLLEWLHGRAVQVSGVRIMLSGPHSSILNHLRDSTDLAVDSFDEKSLYKEYAQRFGWEWLENEHTQESLERSVKFIVNRLHSRSSYNTEAWSPPRFAGPPDAKVVVVGEKLSDNPMPGGWLPFTSRLTTMLGREFRDDAFKLLWTNVEDCDPQLLGSREIIIACGTIASKWCRLEVKGGPGQTVVSIPHPSYVYRFNSEKTRRQLESIRQVVQSLKPLL